MQGYIRYQDTEQNDNQITKIIYSLDTLIEIKIKSITQFYIYPLIGRGTFLILSVKNGLLST